MDYQAISTYFFNTLLDYEEAGVPFKLNAPYFLYFLDTLPETIFFKNQNVSELKITPGYIVGSELGAIIPRQRQEQVIRQEKP